MKICTNVGWALAAIAGIAVAGSASANDLVLSEGAGKARGANRVAVDFVHGGGATALQYEIALPKGVRSVDTSACVADLPSSHTGACNYIQDAQKVIVIVYSDSNADFPVGVVPVGSIEFAGAGRASIQNALLSNADAQPVSVSIASEAGKPVRGGRTEQAK